MLLVSSERRKKKPRPGFSSPSPPGHAFGRRVRGVKLPLASAPLALACTINFKFFASLQIEIPPLHSRGDEFISLSFLSISGII